MKDRQERALDLAMHQFYATVVKVGEGTAWAFIEAENSIKALTAAHEITRVATAINTGGASIVIDPLIPDQFEADGAFEVRMHNIAARDGRAPLMGQPDAVTLIVHASSPGLAVSAAIKMGRRAWQVDASDIGVSLAAPLYDAA